MLHIQEIIIRHIHTVAEKVDAPVMNGGKVKLGGARGRVGSNPATVPYWVQIPIGMYLYI